MMRGGGGGVKRQLLASCAMAGIVLLGGDRPRGASAQAAPAFAPARWESGPLPAGPPPNVAGWIEEMLDVAVDAAGAVQTATPIRRSPLPRDLVAPAVSRWRFRPAAVRGQPVPAHVLVAALFRPPVLYNAPAIGQPAVDLAPAPLEIPFPVNAPPPLYPPLGAGDGVVLVEAAVGADGAVHTARVAAGAPGFTQPALEAARAWRFRAARRDGQPVESFAYLVFGFRRPLAAGQ